MKKKLYQGFMISLCGIGSLSAYVIEPFPITWKGPYGGIILSYEWANLKDAAGQLPTKATPKGFGYGLNLGVGSAICKLFYYGADFSFVLSNASWNASPVAGTNNVFAKARQHFTYQLVAQLGLILGRSYLLYGGIGGGWAKYTGNISYGSTVVDLKGNTSSLAWNVGLKHQTQGIMFDFRYESQPGSYTIKAGNKINARGQALRLGICYPCNF